MAVENTRFYEETRRKLAQLAALQETSRAVVSTLELDALLQLIVQQATSLLHAEGGILNLLDLAAREDEVVASTGSTEKFMGIRYSLEKSLSGWASLHNQPVISNQLREDPRAAPYDGLIETELRNAAFAPLNVKGKVIGTLVVVDKYAGDQDFTQDDLDLLVAFANQAAAAIENARLFRAEQRRAEQFRVIGVVGQQIASAFDVDRLLKQMAHLIQESFGYYHVGIGLVEGNEVVSKAEVGADQDVYDSIRIKLGEGSWGWVAQRGEVHLSPDVRKDPHFYIAPGTDLVRSHLCVPLKSKDAVIGVLSTASSRCNAFDESDVIVLQSLANMAAAAVENIRHSERAQRLAVLEERSRLARELHDAVTQTIFSASLLAEALPEIWENNPQEGRRVTQELRGLSRGALAEMRTLLLELRPSALAETRLEDLLRQLGEAASGREGISVNVAVEGQGTLPPEVHSAFYRIAQEALNNVVKHARASQVTIRLCFTCAEKENPKPPTARSVLLVIRDDGCGFDLARVLPDRLGLGIMQERARAIGATLTIDSHPGDGTQVSVLYEQDAA